MSLTDLLALIAKSGAAGALVGVACAFSFVVALLRGAVRSKREVVDQLAERDKKYEEMKTDRDSWKNQAEGLRTALEKLTDVMEAGQNHGGRR